jgi:hypothetical protein
VVNFGFFRAGVAVIIGDRSGYEVSELNDFFIKKREKPDG